MLNAETRIVVLKLSSLSRSKDARNPTGFVSARSQLLMSCFTHSQKLLTSCVLKSTILNLLRLIGPWWVGPLSSIPIYYWRWRIRHELLPWHWPRPTEDRSLAA